MIRYPKRMLFVRSLKAECLLCSVPVCHAPLIRASNADTGHVSIPAGISTGLKYVADTGVTMLHQEPPGGSKVIVIRRDHVQNLVEALP